MVNRQGKIDPVRQRSRPCNLGSKYKGESDVSEEKKQKKQNGSGRPKLEVQPKKDLEENTFINKQSWLQLQV